MGLKIILFLCSNQIKNLNVILQGKPAKTSDQDPVLGPVERVIILDWNVIFICNNTNVNKNSNTPLSVDFTTG